MAKPTIEDLVNGKGPEAVRGKTVVMTTSRLAPAG